MLDYDLLYKDLELIEQAHKPKIRIFRDKNEVEQFKKAGGDMGGTHFDESTFLKGKGARIEP